MMLMWFIFAATFFFITSCSVFVISVDMQHIIEPTKYIWPLNHNSAPQLYYTAAANFTQSHVTVLVQHLL